MKKVHRNSLILLQMSIFCLLSFYKKGGKIQTRLNCEHGMSEVMLSLSHSKIFLSNIYTLLLLLACSVSISSRDPQGGSSSTILRASSARNVDVIFSHHEHSNHPIGSNQRAMTQND